MTQSSTALQPPPPPPKESMASSQVYMTPQLQKRRDGLCPSLLLDSSPASPSATVSMTKSYKTTSALLNTGLPENGKNGEATELALIVDSVNRTLRGLVGRDKDLVSLDFRPQGCTWKLEYNNNLNGASANYLVHVVCLANQFQGDKTAYVVDTKMINKVPVQGDPKLAPPLRGYREAKAAFEFTALQVRKSIVKCEFPEFPEGCKGRPFREVYQLNARVSPLVSIEITFT